MNMELARLLEETIDRHNEVADKNEHIYWWDVLRDMRDMSDDEEVFDMIVQIERRTDKLTQKINSGY